jgi:hypothetical protein
LVTLTTAESIGSVARLTIDCQALTSCAPTTIGSMPVCGSAACAP